MPKGYSSIALWFNDFVAKNEKTILPNNRYYYGPGSDNPYKWYMYYSFENSTPTSMGGVPSIATYSGTGVMYIISPTRNHIYEIIVYQTSAYKSPEANQILSTFKFTQ